MDFTFFFSYEFLIVLNYYKIVHYHLSLFIGNVNKFDHIILLSLLVFLFFTQFSLSICSYFYKNILN